MKRRLAFTLLLSTTAFLVASSGASAGVVQAFQTVDHKVGCIIDGQGVRCDAKNPKYDPGPPPADCDLDYGQGVFLGRHDPADFVCAGDTALTRGAPELDWQGGEKVKAG